MKILNKVFFSEKIRKLDRYTIDNEGISSLELMERAARIWTDFFLKILDDYKKVAVIAGHGNNGGDGYVVARLLKERGKEVSVFSLSGNFSSDCAENRMRWHREGGEIIEITDGNELHIDSEAIIVDAIFGSGLNRAVEGVKAEVIRKINQLPNRVVSIDLPSGLMGEDNASNNRETIVRADYTFTFQFPKLSFFLPENVDYVDYYVKAETGVKQIDIEAGKFGGSYYLEASTLFRDQATGDDYAAEFIIPNCKVQSNFTFTMAPSGDPSTFTFTMDAFPDYTKFDRTKKVIAALQIVEDHKIIDPSNE